MDAASWPSNAAADTRVDDVNDVDDEELEDDIEAPRPPAPAPGDPPALTQACLQPPPLERSLCQQVHQVTDPPAMSICSGMPFPTRRS